MKTFNKFREDSLLEVLKASDPAGKWIHDFVHSDNPKFAGKSKKERIRMALGASYAAKRANEDVEEFENELEEEKKKTLRNSNPCWTGYHPVGTKQKGGRTVPNCVPNESVDEAAIAMKKAGKKPKGMKEEIEIEEGAFSSGALKPTKEFEKQAAKVPSTGTVRGKDSKGVYTAKTVNGKEVSRVYENKLADKETDFDFHPTLKNKKEHDDDQMVPVHVIKPQRSFSDVRKKNKEQDTHDMDEAYPSYTGDRADKLLKHSGDLYAKSTTETDPAKKTSLVAQSNKAHKVAMKAKAQHHKRNPAEVQAYVSHAMKPPKGWTNEETEQVSEKFWDNEGEMVVSQLKGVIAKAEAIISKLSDDSKLEAWVQSEVTTAENSVTCVHDYLMYSKDAISK